MTWTIWTNFHSPFLWRLHVKFGFNWFGMAAILVMWPEPFEQTFVPPSKGGSTWNLASISPVVSEEEMFENVDIHTYMYPHMHRRRRATYTLSSPGQIDMFWTAFLSPVKGHLLHSRYEKVVVCSRLTSLSTIFQSYHECLVAKGNSVLTFIVLPHWSIIPRHSTIPHPVTLSWHWVDHFSDLVCCIPWSNLWPPVP